MSFILFKNVDKCFGSKQVLSQCSLDIHKGEILTIIGGSGMGKSVFLKLLLGILEPDLGDVFFDGIHISQSGESERVALRRRMGMLFQSAALFDSLTVRENIAYPIREHFNYSEEKISRIVAEKLEMVGLEGIEDMMPADLSGGMKKRIGLARAIAINPEVILYDEPTTGLDPRNTKRICQLIKDLNSTLNVTSIVVTHDMDAAFSITDRMAMLYDRHFAFVGTAKEARSSTNRVVAGFINGQMASEDDEL